MERIFSVVKLVLSLTRVDLLFGQVPTPNITITQADLEKAGTSIQVASIGEPVNSVILDPTRWVDVTGATPAHGIVEGSMMLVDPDNWPINFRVLLPARWRLHMQQRRGRK